jgi:hypothetical protein
VKHGKRYRYYVSRPREAGARSGWRLPAHDIETLVTTELAAFFSNQQRLCDTLQPWGPSPDQLERAFHGAEVLSGQFRGSAAERRTALLEAASEIRLKPTELVIELRASALLPEVTDGADATDVIPVRVPTVFQRRAAEINIIVPGRETASTPDPALIKAVARGYAWFEELATGRASTIAEIAGRENVTDRYVSSLLKLAFLPPALIDACLGGDASELSALETWSLTQLGNTQIDLSPGSVRAAVRK